MNLKYDNDLTDYQHPRYEGYGKLFGDNLLEWQFNNKSFTNTKKIKSRQLWNVALEAISYMPILMADYKSGIILTDWYLVNKIHKKIKIDIKILHSDTVESSLRLAVFTTNGRDTKLEKKLLAEILTKMQ